MRHSASGYVAESRDVTAFRAAAKKLAEVLPGLMKELNATVIAVRGKSGVSMAFALLMLADFHIVTVRKPGENSHGDNIEGVSYDCVDREFSRYIILDDFVGSGATCKAIVDALANEVDGNDAVCAGIVEYQCASDDGSRPVICTPITAVDASVAALPRYQFTSTT
jgi:orotate phosphoribosyltransferase-like protein